MSRAITREVFINASPETVFQALTEADQLTRWFPVDAKVEPGLGGSIWLSWDTGADATQGRAPITAWDPPRRFQWTEDRGPVKLAVDFHVEGRDGGTVVRLVQSGFGGGPEWDDEFHMTSGGWHYFMTHLQWYLNRHHGAQRDLIFCREAIALPRPEVFDRLVAALSPFDTHIVADARATYQLGLVLPALNDAMLFIEIEPHKSGARAGYWLSTYGLSPAALSRAREEFTGVYRRALGLT